MTTIGCAELKGGRVSLFGLLDGKPLAPDSRPEHVLMSRTDFDVQIVDIPPVSDKELEGLLRYRLRSIYPGSPAATAFDYRMGPEEGGRRATLFICPRAALEKYRAAAGQARLLLPWSFTAELGKRKGDAVILFLGRGYAELSVYRGGILQGCSVRQRAGLSSEKLSAVLKTLPEEARKLPCILVAPDGDLEKGKDLPAEIGKGVELITYSRLVREVKKPDALFQEKKKKPVLLSPMGRVAGLAALVVVLGVLIFVKLIASTDSRYEQLRKLDSTLETQSRRIVGMEGEVDSLSAQLSSLKARQPLDVYLLFSELSSVLGSGTRIRTITLRGDSFQIEAVGTNPLKLMEEFRSHPSFSDVKLSQVIPDAASGRERFSFSGVFNAR